MINAQEAREISERVANAGIDVVSAAIRKEAEAGHVGLLFAVRALPRGSNPARIERQLREYGYKVSYESDQRDGDYLQIRWGEEK